MFYQSSLFQQNTIKPPFKNSYNIYSSIKLKHKNNIGTIYILSWFPLLESIPNFH